MGPESFCAIEANVWKGMLYERDDKAVQRLCSNKVSWSNKNVCWKITIKEANTAHKLAKLFRTLQKHIRVAIPIPKVNSGTITWKMFFFLSFSSIQPSPLLAHESFVNFNNFITHHWRVFENKVLIILKFVIIFIGWT